MTSYEVRTLKGGRWMTELRCSDQEEAVHQARELVGSRHFQEIMVISETFVEDENVFRERVVFKHSQPAETQRPTSQGAARRPSGQAGQSRQPQKNRMQRLFDAFGN